VEITHRHCAMDNDNVEMEHIIYYGIDDIVTIYDDKLFRHLKEREYEQCEQVLSDFCFELLDLPDMEQTFIARVFYISIVTDIIGVQKRKGRLHPRSLTYSYELIAKVEKWENLSEFIINNKTFMEQIRKYIIADDVLFHGCPHLTKALQLIDQNLQENYLTVSWLAKKISISTTHLTNLFKLRIGDTVSSYITKRKLNEIVFEMTYTSKSLKEIREKYGYVNHSHFIQHFKKHFGKTPLQYKQDL